jgi:carbamoyltransferase
MATYILGISAFFHDSAAALIRDGEIIAAAQEERFTRSKGDANFPVNAIAYCLEEAGIEVGDLDIAVFYERPMTKFERILETYLSYSPKGLKSLHKALTLWSTHRLKMTSVLRKELGPGFHGEVLYTDHHASHAASAFFPSPFEEAAILTLDAVGEWSTSSIGMGKGNSIRLDYEMRFPHSLGMLYSAITYYTGFKVNSGEYKLMGLAPYGDPVYTDRILDKLVKVYDDGSIALDMSYFDFAIGFTMTSEKFHNLFGGPPRKPESFLTKKEMDLAASIQKVTEEIFMKAGNHVHKLTGQKNLVLAGGVALNCVANGILLREGPFENIWIQPAAGDAGGSLGAALYVWYQKMNNRRIVNNSDSQKGSLLGPSFNPVHTRLILDSVGADYEYIENESELIDRVSTLMAEEKVIGWFQGRMEYGPRALGSRSIIGDARSTKMQQVMNLKIKFRESFRPFAPCVLREHVYEYFEMRENEDSPYMLLVAPVRDKYRTKLSEKDMENMKSPDLRIRVAVPRSTIPAITHVDYSARVQTVDEERHGRYYRLMKRFYEKTGCPVIVNTSFNIRGEPIVCNPEDAYQCFMATDMDYLVIDNYILDKTKQGEALLPGLHKYKTEINLD